MGMVTIKVRVSEDHLHELERFATERRQSRAVLGGLLIENGVSGMVEDRLAAVTATGRSA